MKTLALIIAALSALFDLAGEAQAATPLNDAQWYHCEWYIEEPSNMAYFYDGLVGVLVAKDSDGLVRYVGMSYKNQSIGEFESYELNEWTDEFTAFITPPESDTYAVSGKCEIKPL